jgi:hypothetical protein
VTGRRARQRSAAEFPVQRRPSRQTAASRPDPTCTTQMSGIGWHDRSQGLLRSEQRLDGCDSHQILHGIGDLPTERDQSVGLELGQSDVLGVKRVRLPELVDIPCRVLKLVVFVQPDPHPARVEEASLGSLLGHLTAVYCLVEE